MKKTNRHSRTDPHKHNVTGTIEKTHNCRGIVTADVLAKGLSRRAVATRKLKGVNRDKGHAKVLYWFGALR